MTTRLFWLAVEWLSLLLDEREREVVRGDLAECGSSPSRALREVVELVIRRQAAAWLDWRPWFTLASVVIPIGFLLSHASRWWGVHAAIELKNYWVLWDFSYLAYPGYRNDVIRMAMWIVGAWLALIGWSWTSGFVVGRLSGRAIWLTIGLFAVFIFAATLGTITTATRSPNPSLQYHLVFVVFPRLVRTFLVLLPMALGAHRGSQRVHLRLAPALLGVCLLAGVTFLISQGLERSVVFGRGLVPPDTGPDGFFFSADDPRPWWPLSFLMMWPAAFVVADAASERWRDRIAAAR
jgi:hypothetical protein